MGTSGEELANLLAQYDEYWLQHVARIEQKIHLLHTLKQGVELLLLVSSYLFYYLIDCVAQIMALPIIR